MSHARSRAVATRNCSFPALLVRSCHHVNMPPCTVSYFALSFVCRYQLILPVVACCRSQLPLQPHCDKHLALATSCHHIDSISFWFPIAVLKRQYTSWVTQAPPTRCVPRGHAKTSRTNFLPCETLCENDNAPPNSGPHKIPVHWCLHLT